MATECVVAARPLDQTRGMRTDRGVPSLKDPLNSSDISSIDHLIMREFVSGPPRYHLAIKGVREQFVVVEQNSGP